MTSGCSVRYPVPSATLRARIEGTVIRFPGTGVGVARLVALVEKHEAAARVGAAKLPFRSRWAVLSAARIYGAIGRKVRKRGPDAWASRTYVPRWEKALYGLRALASSVVNREKMPEGGITWGIADFRPQG